MVETCIVATPSAKDAAKANKNGKMGIALYNMGTSGVAGLGHTLNHSARTLPRPPTIRAWDFLSIALAVYGADRFALRGMSPDGWTRVITLEIALVEPDPWNANVTRLEEALRFLSGDIWKVRFKSGGQKPPDFQSKLTDRDCACLFSGGLDSLIGAMDLMSSGRTPLLASQASPKEGTYQKFLAQQIGAESHQFTGRVTERAAPPYEPSSRARSILFFAYGILAASSIKKSCELFIPENGLISINPPLTRRRVGSYSTRTTHPHFMSLLQNLLDDVGLDVRLVNPYSTKTKGEMLKDCGGKSIEKLASLSYSCGKGKRLNKHCGCCVPCLIRRASFYKAGIQDKTSYHIQDLVKRPKNDDVYSARLAIASLSHKNIERWATESGPLSDVSGSRSALIAVVGRGMAELGAFLNTVKWP